MSYQQANYHAPGYGTIYPPPPVYPSAPPQPSYGYPYQGYPPPPPQYPHCDHHHHHHDGGGSPFLQGWLTLPS